MNVRHVTRVSLPASKQRAQTYAVKCLPVWWLRQRCAMTVWETTLSRSTHTLQINPPNRCPPSICLSPANETQYSQKSMLRLPRRMAGQPRHHQRQDQRYLASPCRPSGVNRRLCLVDKQGQASSTGDIAWLVHCVAIDEISDAIGHCEQSLVCADDAKNFCGI